MPVRVEVEIDLFSGMPNPAWLLTGAEATSFLTKLSALPPNPAVELSHNLGYRGFVIQLTEGEKSRPIHIQNGVVHTAIGTTVSHTHDYNRELERWLLETGKPYLEDEIIQLVENEFE